MKHYTDTTHVGNVAVTRIVPLSPNIVRFSLTGKIPGGAERFTQPTLSLYAALLLTKTKHKTKRDIEEYLKQYGISLTVTTGIESVTFTGSVRKEHVTKLASLLTELLFEPIVAHQEFVEKQKLMVEANREAHDNAKRIAHIAFVNTLYDGEPRLTLDTLGEELTHIKKLKEADVVRLHKDLPMSIWYLSIVGDTQAEHGFMSLLRALEPVSRPLSRTPILMSPKKNTTLYTTVPGKTNIEVQLGNVIAMRSDDPAFVPLDFGIDVLGKVGGFSGRLMSTVREKEGLTYGIYAHTNPHHLGDSFHFVIRTFFMAKDYVKGLASTKRELISIVENGITEKELVTFKEISKNEFILAHESNMSRLTLYHTSIVRGHTEQSLREFQERIERLTRKEVNRALRENIHPDKLVLSAAGPISKEGKPLTTEKA
jgi:zinc protease